MEGLSLLCNLHADGPLTLRRLRAAGVHDLTDLPGVPEATLSACLRSDPRQARRFVEEGRQLALRLAESALDPEPCRTQAGLDGGEGSEEEYEEEYVDESHTEGEPARAFAEECAHDAQEPLQVPQPADDVPADEVPAHGWSLVGAARAVAARAAEAEAERAAELESALALEAAAEAPPDECVDEHRLESLPGLGAATRERLLGQGVCTLETLVQRASLALARASGIPFAQLLDLASRARSALAPPRGASGAAAAEIEVEIVPEVPRRAPALAGRSLARAPAAAPGAHTVGAGEPGPAGPFG